MTGGDKTQRRISGEREGLWFVAEAGWVAGSGGGGADGGGLGEASDGGGVGGGAGRREAAAWLRGGLVLAADRGAWVEVVVMVRAVDKEALVVGCGRWRRWRRWRSCGEGRRGAGEGLWLTGVGAGGDAGRTAVEGKRRRGGGGDEVEAGGGRDLGAGCGGRGGCRREEEETEAEGWRVERTSGAGGGGESGGDGGDWGGAGRRCAGRADGGRSDGVELGR